MTNSVEREPKLNHGKLPNCSIDEIEQGYWRLFLQPGEKNQYRWAQLDDYAHLPRPGFLWRAPVSLSLRARVSAADIPGTWGFGFWNDPFNVSMGLGGTTRRLPAFPDAAWFFYASPPNHLAFSDHHPAQGLLAASFASRKMPSLMFFLAAPLLGFLTVPFLARGIRRLAQIFVKEDAKKLDVDITQWHHYRIDWNLDAIKYYLDYELIFETRVVPHGNMGLVLWIDNQYAAFPPDGKVRLGKLESNQPVWLELKEIRIGDR